MRGRGWEEVGGRRQGEGEEGRGGEEWRGVGKRAELGQERKAIGKEKADGK